MSISKGHLRRIILIHTHIEGVVELQLDAHANICGSNGAGKTTLQRLIPVFYGQLPNQVVPRTRQSFQEFYLPRSNSYLVFEYQREAGDTAMAVLTRNANLGVEYRFVAAPYEPHLFLASVENKLQGVSYGEHTSRLRQAGIESSRKLTATSEYRSVILNDLSRMPANSSEARQLRQLSMAYSLVNTGGRLRHMEKLVSAIHAGEGKMDTLKTMLADILADEGMEPPYTRLRGQQIQDWVRRMRQSLDLESLDQELSRWESLGQNLVAREQRLCQLEQILQEDQAEQAEARQAADEQIQQLEQSLQQLQAEWQSQYSQLNSQRLEYQQNLTYTQKTLDDIQQTYDAYLNRDMDELARAMAQIPQWRRDRDEQAQHLQVLKSRGREIEQSYERHRAELHEKLNANLQQLADALQKEQQSLNELERQHVKQRQALNDQYQQDREETAQAFHEQEIEYQKQQADIKARQQADLLSAEERDQQQQVRSRIEQARQQARLAEQQVNRAAGQYQQTRQERAEAVREVEHRRQQRLQCEEACQRLQKQGAPRAGSLRHFLREQMPGWEQSLGKVVREDLLERRDLAPQLTDQPPNLLGVQLDLSAVSLPDHALDETALQDALQKARHDWQQAQQAEEAQTRHIKKLEETLRRQHEEQQARQRQLQDVQQEVAYAEDARQRLEEEHNALTRQRRQQLQDKLAQVEKQLQGLTHDKQQRLQTLKERYQQQHQELKADADEREQRQKDRIKQLETSRRQTQQSHDQRLRELKAHHDAQLEEKGIDAATFRQAEDRLEQLRNQIEQTLNRQEELRDYQQFMKVRWNQEKPELIQKEAELQHSLQQLETRIEQGQQRHDARQQEQQQTRRVQQERRQQADDWHEQLTRLLQQIQALQLRGDSETQQQSMAALQGDQDERINRARHLLQEQAQYQQQLEMGLKRFDSQLIQDADADFVHQLKQRLEQQGTAGQTHLQAMLVIYRQMLQLLHDRQAELVNQGRNIGGDLKSFFDLFRDLNRRIQAQSRRISAELGQDLTLEGISRAEVRLKSTVEELEFWQPLSRFVRLYDDWQTSGRTLPGKEYLDSLAHIAGLLRHDQIYDFAGLLELELHLTESGNALVIRNDRQLLEASSHGMAYLILCQFLLAFTRMLRGRANVVLHWPIDEIGTLAYRNVEQLFKACDANDIYILGAFPNAEADVLSLFTHRYLLEKDSDNEDMRRLKQIAPQVDHLREKIQAMRQQESS